MENVSFRKLRYHAARFGFKFSRVNKDGYRIFTIKDMTPITEIDGVNCAGILSLADIQSVIADLVAKKARRNIEQFTPANI